ncbi:LysR family transcriptional regulator [Ensifer sp. T173]|uniref:LysR family transcriptional regulator n=2 Tax=Sinorhizobium/Ensifer group TaxID=227292 RepID=A0AAW4FMP1_9HYPH|nr:LysR family transcriptional regulator [Ensifer sp. Root31]KQW55142.1 LysR family transcriptional regulator [Ensifer sp. Root127]KQW62074.1 LysR family transcriptional regulator [Ensifer sp. Root1252]KQY79205.1 LysR family transcriptional regulator [Ensifer sp. Root142]KRC83227.1 LysR family transcriptional regulator [Ensifer sp. Root231]KRC85100.1 LysR family transcriptional regulator [Ensifer sp. Root258]MBD9487299.1 LysR family transcriptional regulator [Ensifer sp. ENS11]MBM3091280.1 L
MDVLDAKALKIFMAVARIGSIRGAAEHMGLAPSVVSRQIADTEREIGLALFERTARGTVLTDAGELVLEHGKRVLEDNGLLAEQLDQIRGVQQTRIRIRCGEGFMADLVEHGLSSFSRAHSYVRYIVELGSTEDVVDAIANSDADIGIAYTPLTDPRIRALAIARQPLCVIAPIGHALASRTGLKLADCLTSPCAMLGKGNGVTQIVARVAADAGMALAPLLETHSIEVLRRFVASGLGVTFLPRTAVSGEIDRGVMQAVDLEDPLLREASAHLMVRAHRRLPLSVEKLGQHLAQEMQSFKA